jgi:twitching motility two-component system response regulator PilH
MEYRIQHTTHSEKSSVALILVVDDAQTDRELMARIVTDAGHLPLLAADGREAIALAKQHKPALIFLDVVMPIMDGFATCRHLRRDPETASIPVVLVTAKQKESDVFWGKKQGASEHLGKPWNKSLMEAMIKRYCTDQ